MVVVPELVPVLYVTEQLLLFPTGLPSVQLVGVKLAPPPALVEKLTMPLGDPPPGEMSVTVAVQVALEPWKSCDGVQVTLVLVRWPN